MKTIVLFACSLPVTLAGFAWQEPPNHGPAPKTPQQQYQQEFKKFLNEHNRLQAQAKQVFDAEMAREKAGDCPDAKSTRAIEPCYEKQSKITQSNYTTFAQAIRTLLALEPPPLPQAVKTGGVAGPVLAPEQELAGFEKVEQLWQSYNEALCTAAFHQFGGGTGGPPAEMECRQRLLRSHMRELDAAYGIVLHL